MVKVERDVVGETYFKSNLTPGTISFKFAHIQRLHVYVASFNGEINVVFIVIPSTINDFRLIAYVYLLKEQKTKIIIL